MLLSITITSLTLLVTISLGPTGSVYTCTISTLMILLVSIATLGTMRLLSFMEGMKKLTLMDVKLSVTAATLDSVKRKSFTVSSVSLTIPGHSFLPGDVIVFGGSSSGPGVR